MAESYARRGKAEALRVPRPALRARERGDGEVEKGNCDPAMLSEY